MNQFHWLSGLRRGSATVLLLGLRVQIPPAYGFQSLLSVVCCMAEVSATGRILVQKGPTECGVSLCVILEPQERGGPGPCWAVEREERGFV